MKFYQSVLLYCCYISSFWALLPNYAPAAVGSSVDVAGKHSAEKSSRACNYHTRALRHVRNGSGTLCGIHTYVGEDDNYVGFVPASSIFPQFVASATHILVSIFTVNRYTYPGLLLLL